MTQRCFLGEAIPAARERPGFRREKLAEKAGLPLTAAPQLAAVNFPAGFGPQSSAPEPPKRADAPRTHGPATAPHWCWLGGAPVLLGNHSLVHGATHWD